MSWKNRLAEPWYRRHQRLHLNSHRDLSTPPGVDYPAGTPETELPGLWFTGMRPSIRGCFAKARIQANTITQQIARQGR
ncbi:hypothetical protein BQ8794_160008 [Mesorhizobium prunaredense]|uniref:Uncharacterized protein n=1 Tax=Mesorhizobium prunaredense TaxID=1631249 RepID=A0A1R3V3C5_9HYPH|nr:hypothetical protein [Mesorhizobium prunaredense]SIT54404.1 hypothetical protein BQ8794_160008 [Mesorhizobium prunaredense]